jgi:hypothetical protein
MNQDQLWEAIHELFDTISGELPEIDLDCLSGHQIIKIFSLLAAHSKEILGTFWDNKMNADRPICSVENAAKMVVEGKASCFHALMRGIEINGTAIPDLGVFVYEDNMSLDYRMGPKWGPRELAALFQLLGRIKKLAPDIKVRHWDEEPGDMQGPFQKTWQEYLRENLA